MTDSVKKVKDSGQDAEEKMITSEDHAEVEPSSETLDKDCCLRHKSILEQSGG